jgi:TPR repeat protein
VSPARPARPVSGGHVAPRAATLTALLFLAVTVAPADDAFSGGLEAFERGDYRAAYEAWKPLAERGLVEAQYNLGLLHQVGRGVPVDPEEAARWYEKAAQAGFARAQYDLARLHESRETVPGNLVRAYAWYKLAGQQRYLDARKRRRRVADRLTPYEIAQADLFVREWNAGQNGRREGELSP